MQPNQTAKNPQTKTFTNRKANDLKHFSEFKKTAA
jgi:hypothetical protein